MRSHLTAFLMASVTLAPSIASAGPLTVDFTITADYVVDAAGNEDGTSYNGYGLGTVGGGYFVVDSSLGNIGNPDGPGRAPLALQFDFAGAHFDETTAAFWTLLFSPQGELLAWNLGALPSGLAGLSSPGPTDFWAQGAVPHSDYDYAMVHVEGANHVMGGRVDWSVRAVPEPGTLGLLGLGLLGLAGIRRRQG